MNQSIQTAECALISEAKNHFESAKSALRKSCEHALLAGMRLIVIHSETAGVGHGGARSIGSSVPRGTPKKGFEGAVDEIGIPKRTAYRWINATYAAANKIYGYSPENFPAHGSDEWLNLECGLTAAAQGMSLSRLMLGCQKSNSEDQRQDEIIAQAEDGNVLAEQVLAKVAEGSLTWVQAIRSLSGAVATKDKTRKDPVYFALNEDESLDGLFVKSITTLKNAATQWPELPKPVQVQARNLWLSLVAAMPAEIKKF